MSLPGRARVVRMAAIVTCSAIVIALGFAVVHSMRWPGVPDVPRATRSLAAAPPMGWNDWNAFGCDVSADLVEKTADAMVANGLASVGYRYVNIDDCWMSPERNPRTGRLVPDSTKFPNGITAVVAHVHSLGLRIGIYEDAGVKTCAGFPGSLGHERVDAQTFADWGIDYLKYDNCYRGGSNTTRQYIHRFRAMRDALDSTGRPILFSICEWGFNHPWTWAPRLGESWRTTKDIADSYGRMLAIFHENVGLYRYAGPGGWNDPDMLEIGNGGMTTEEYRTEFSLWAAMAAPLVAGTDLTTISEADLAIYKNSAVIAVDQDRLGRQAVPIAAGGRPAGSDGLWVLSKPLANGDHAVVLFNSTGAAATVSTTAIEAGLPLAPHYLLDDLWTGQSATSTGAVSATIPAHGVAMLRIIPKRP